MLSANGSVLSLKQNEGLVSNIVMNLLSIISNSSKVWGPVDFENISGKVREF
jgi:hypothetical protein